MVPKHYKTGKDTTAKLDIERLGKKYPKDKLYGLAIRAREHQHLIGTYIDGQVPGPDNRLRTHFTYKPATGRLSAEDANVQNQPKRGDLAKLFREQFVPVPGWGLYEFDYKAMQAVIIGYLAKDEDFIKAARLGVHAILASHVLAREGHMAAPITMDLPPEEIKALISWIKAAHDKTYDDCKHVVYGSSFGGTAYKMHMDFPASFPRIADAEELQKLYFSTVGRKIKAWILETLDKAHYQHYLDSPFGHRHEFWNVYTKYNKRQDGRWDLVSGRYGSVNYGSEAKDALAFLPQAIERCVQIEAAGRIAERGYEGVLRWPIHDSLLCEIQLDNAEAAVGVIKEEMERPVPELDGLWFEVDVKSSVTHWGAMR